MFRFIYIERELKNHPRVRALCDRFKQATVVECERYQEIFNLRAQNFRLQKQAPALILARKTGNLILKTPPGYGIGGAHNYYFSHLLNCIYDCRYCFLQGMYRSAHLVLFVNYEDFGAAIAEQLGREPESHFFSGYDCDSLALDAVTEFSDFVLPFFAGGRGLLELRTKSVQTKSLLGRPAERNCVVAFSFTPDATSQAVEAGVPSVKRRIAAMKSLAEAGWPVGLRFDPVIWRPDYAAHYEELFVQIFSALPEAAIHSVSLGAFRLPSKMFKTMHGLYPEERLFAFGLAQKGRMVTYDEPRGETLLGDVRQALSRYVTSKKLFECQDLSVST